MQHQASVSMVKPAQAAKRAFVKVLLALAAVYGIILDINRDVADQSLRTAFRKLARRGAKRRLGTPGVGRARALGRDGHRSTVTTRRRRLPGSLWTLKGNCMPQHRDVSELDSRKHPATLRRARP